MIEFEEKDYSEDLNPCPFCGEDHVSQVFNGSDQYISSFWVMCGNCDAEGPVDKTEDGAVEKWNNRCKYAPEIPIEQTYGQKATDCCGVKNDEGDYIAAARKETFEKLEPLRKALFNIARDSEVSCNTKNCKLYSSKAEQNCNGINSGISPSINDCPKYTPKDAPEYVRMKHNITDIQEEFCANPCCPNHSIPMGRENHYHKCERDDLSSTDDIIYTHPIRKGIWLCENCISAIDFFINLK